MLSGNCSEWSTDRAYIPCPTVTIVKWCHTVMQTVRQHQEGGRWTSTWKKTWLKIEKLTNILTSEVILQPSRTSMADHSCRNSLRLKFFSYFRRKAPPQMFFWALNMSLYLIWLTYQQTFFKVGTKDTETVPLSLMGTLNTLCLTYSFDGLLFKWHYYILPLTIPFFIL